MIMDAIASLRPTARAMVLNGAPETDSNTDQPFLGAHSLD